MSSVDTSQLLKALNDRVSLAKKTIPVILNKAALNIGYKASQFTPKTTAAKIKRDLKRDPHLVYALTVNRMKKKGENKPLKSPQFAEKVQKFINQRASSAAFIRLGWSEGILALGGTYRGKRPLPQYRHGGAKKATILRFVAEISNTSRGIDKVGKKALQDAVDYVAKDMIEHDAPKLLAAAIK